MLEAILHKGPLTQRELGRKVLTSAGNMTDVVDKLEARGLVRRVRDAARPAAVRVELTEPGRALIEALFPRHAADIARGDGGPVARPSCAQLGELLRRLGMAGRARARMPPPLRRPPTRLPS